MKIREIKRQNRRDFWAEFECESCGKTVEQKGYDDAHYHRNVIPTLKCPECGAVAPDNYRPLTTRHPEGFQI